MVFSLEDGKFVLIGHIKNIFVNDNSRHKATI